MTQVKITGKLKRHHGLPAEGNSWGGATIDVQFHGYSQTATEQRPSDRDKITTNPDGTWEHYVWRNSEGDYDSYYTFKFPYGQPIKVVLTAATPNEIPFSQLAIASTPPDDPTYPSLIAIINDQLAASGVSFPAGGNAGQVLGIAQTTPRVFEWQDAGVSFTQSVAAATWTFNHTLNRVPALEVTDLAGNRLFVETQATLIQAIVKSLSPVTGILYLI
jgi:hypothetical protein